LVVSHSDVGRRNREASQEGQKQLYRL
jgi:hypothetical protein